MVLASIAYRSKTLKRGLSAVDFKQKLELPDSGNIPIPINPALAYSSKSISDDFSVVLSTEDSEVSGVLGNDGAGGTKSGFQAVILKHNVTGAYYLTVAGVAGDGELLATYNSVNKHGFRYEWSKDLVAFMDIASQLENRPVSFSYTYGHSGALSTIFGADVYLANKNNGARFFGQVVTFQGFGPTGRRLPSQGGFGLTPDTLASEVGQDWYKVIQDLPYKFGLFSDGDFDKSYVNISVGNDVISELNPPFGVKIDYKEGGGTGLLSQGSDHYFPDMWIAADHPGNDRPMQSSSVRIHQSFYGGISLGANNFRNIVTLPVLEHGFYVGNDKYSHNIDGSLSLVSSSRRILKTDKDGIPITVGILPIYIGQKDYENNLTVIRMYKREEVGKPSNDVDFVSVNIAIRGNPLPFEFSDIGAALGQQLGYRLAGGNAALGVLSSALLQTVGDNLGDVLDGVISGGNMVSRTAANGKSVTGSVNVAFSEFGDELLTNLKSAGVGAISSFLTAQLVKVLGADGFAGEILNTTAGAVIGQIVSNIAGIGNPVDGIFTGISPEMIGNAIGSFLGAKLAAELVTFDTIGGQLGAAVGSAVASTAAGIAIGAATPTGLAATFAQFGLAGGIAGVAIAAFLGFIIGGLIGSVFGGTPRSGADALWDEAQGKFIVTNVYSRKGGSKDAARLRAWRRRRLTRCSMRPAGGLPGPAMSPRVITACASRTMSIAQHRLKTAISSPTACRPKTRTHFRRSPAMAFIRA
jgi:hypothetical protein